MRALADKPVTVGCPRCHDRFKLETAFWLVGNYYYCSQACAQKAQINIVLSQVGS